MTASHLRAAGLAAAASLLALALAAGCSLPAAGTRGTTRAAGARSAPADRSFDGYTVHVTQRGETLSSIAGDILGDSSAGWIIADFNGVERAVPGEALAVPLGPVHRGGLRGDRYQTIPVLSYHKFSETESDSMTVTRENFEAQMRLLRDEGYRVVTLDRFFDFLDFKADLPEKAVVITVDDGWRSFYDIAYPILKKYGYPVTLFIYTGMITGSEKTLSWDLIREMAAGGVDMEAHTVTHRNLSKREDGESWAAYLENLDRELGRANEVIREKLGRAGRYLAYPYGEANLLVVDLVKRHGYRGAFTVARGSNPFYVDNYRVGRSMIYGEFDLERFRKNLSDSSRKALQ